MKKILSLTLAALMLTGMLSGCGERLAGTERPGETTVPGVTEDPNRILPDPREGEVRDTDGIIDEHDSGPYTSGTVNGANGSTTNGTGINGTNNGAVNGNAGNRASDGSGAKR